MNSIVVSHIFLLLLYFITTVTVTVVYHTPEWCLLCYHFLQTRPKRSSWLLCARASLSISLFPSTQRTQSKYESVRVTIKFPKFIILILSRQKYRTLEAKVSRIHPLHFQFFPRETRKPSSDVPAKCRDTWPSLPIHLFTAFPPLLSTAICVDDPGRLIERGNWNESIFEFLQRRIRARKKEKRRDWWGGIRGVQSSPREWKSEIDVRMSLLLHRVVSTFSLSTDWNFIPDEYWPRAIGSISTMDLRLFGNKGRGDFFSIRLMTRNFGIDRAILFSFCFFFSFFLTL